jgi:hypothetical protein
MNIKEQIMCKVYGNVWYDISENIILNIKRHTNIDVESDVWHGVERNVRNTMWFNVRDNIRRQYRESNEY